MVDRESISNMIQPQISDSDATMVDVYGLKSKAADDAIEKKSRMDEILAGTGGKNIFGQEVPALTEEDLLELAMGIAGGIKTPGRMFGSIPKATKKMPKTQYQYEKPEFTPNPTGTFRNKQNVLVNVETTPQRLFRELTEGSLDSYEFQMKLRELEDIAPEMAGKVINAIGF